MRKIVATPADFCGVSTPTVSKYHKRLQEEGLLPEISKLNAEEIKEIISLLEANL